MAEDEKRLRQFRLVGGRGGGYSPDRETALRNNINTSSQEAINEGQKLESTWTFAAGTTGAVGAHTLFTVTGNVLVSVFGICDTSLTESLATATIEVGIAGNTAAILAQINAVDLDDGEIWVDSAPATVEAVPSTFILNDGADVVLTVGAQSVSAGVVDFYCLWRPLSSGATVTVTTPA